MLKLDNQFLGSDFAAIDDLSIQEAACRPNYFILPDIEEKLTPFVLYLNQGKFWRLSQEYLESRIFSEDRTITDAGKMQMTFDFDVKRNWQQTNEPTNAHTYTHTHLYTRTRKVYTQEDFHTPLNTRSM